MPNCMQGFAMCQQIVPGSSTLWGCTSLPQHRELSMVNCGDGHLRLYKYHYPERRHPFISLCALVAQNPSYHGSSR
jgi:hypothetical protein